MIKTFENAGSILCPLSNSGVTDWEQGGKPPTLAS